MNPPRVIVRPSAYPVPAGLVDELLDELAPSLQGRTVLVKPNCLMASPPEKGVTTHPSLVRALVASLAGRGAVVQVGDNPGARGYGAVERCFRATGILDAAGDAFVDFGKATAKVPLTSRFADQAVVSRHLLEADYVISLPKLKTHCLTLLTGAVKNMYGVLSGGEKLKFHTAARARKDFAEALVDVYSIRPPDLAVVDAVTAMEGDGPSGGSLRQVGLLLASDNPVAADAAAAALMGVEALKVEHLAIAEERGLGPATPGRYLLDGDLAPVTGFRLPSTFRMGVMNALANRVVFSFLHRSRLQVIEDRCACCGECLEACPAGAVETGEGAYHIDNEICHQCFCCYEICPEGAVQIRGPLGALLKGR